MLGADRQVPNPYWGNVLEKTYWDSISIMIGQYSACSPAQFTSAILVKSSEFDADLETTRNFYIN